MVTISADRLYCEVIDPSRLLKDATDQAIPEDRAEYWAELRDAAAALVDRYAPAAPDNVSNRAAARVAAYWHRSTPGLRIREGEYPAGRASAPLRSSGAAALLQPWKRRRAVAGAPLPVPARPAATLPDPVTPPPAPAQPTTWAIAAGWSDDTTFQAAEFTVEDSSAGASFEIAAPQAAQNGYLGLWLEDRSGAAVALDAVLWLPHRAPVGMAAGIPYSLNNVQGTLFVSGVALRAFAAGDRLAVSLL